jgi:crossover junction endodeoxyribonuclease RuvC
MILAGIDPGLSGAVALLDTARPEHVQVFDMPVLALSRGGKNKRELDAHALARALAQPIGHAFVEQVGAMPGQGVSSVFAFGRAYGCLLGILAAQGVPMTTVAPRRWKTALGVPANKDGARARASQLLPAAAHQWSLKRHDGRAEAALLSLYGFRALVMIAGTVALDDAAE